MLEHLKNPLFAVRELLMNKLAHPSVVLERRLSQLQTDIINAKQALSQSLEKHQELQCQFEAIELADEPTNDCELKLQAEHKKREVLKKRLSSMETELWKLSSKRKY